MPLDDEQRQKLEQARAHSLANASYLQKLNALVEQLLEVLPEHIETEGLFRISGEKPLINRTLQEYWFDPNQKHLKDYTEQDHSIHTKTGMLKQRVMNLTPELVFADQDVQEIFKQFRDRVDKEEPMGMESLIQALVDKQKMEEAKFLYNIMHISRLIADQSDINKMQEMNLAIAFLGPNLMPILGLTNETDDPLQAMQTLAAFNNVVVCSLKAKEEDEFYFKQPFEDRFPQAALKCAEDVMQSRAVQAALPERRQASDAAPAESVAKEDTATPVATQPSTSIPRTSGQKKGWGIIKGITSAAKTVGDYISQFDLVKKFNNYYKMYLTDPKQFAPELLIGNPTLIRQAATKLTLNDRILTINEENATIVLKDIEREMDKMFQEVGNYGVGELRQAQQRLEMIQKELAVIREKIPAKDDHRVTPSVMNSAELVGVVRKALQQKATTTTVPQHARQKLASEVAREAASAVAKRGRVDATTVERKVKTRKR